MDKKIKGQYMNRSTFQLIKYMNGSFSFSKARYTNEARFEIQARTSVHKYLKLPPPHTLKVSKGTGNYAYADANNRNRENQ